METSVAKIVALAVGIPLFVMTWAFFLAAAVQASPQQREDVDGRDRNDPPTVTGILLGGIAILFSFSPLALLPQGDEARKAWNDPETGPRIRRLLVAALATGVTGGIALLLSALL